MGWGFSTRRDQKLSEWGEEMDSDMTPMADWPYSLKKQTLKRHWLTDTQAPTHLLSLLSMQSEASSCHFLSLCIHQGSCSSNTYIPQGLAGHLFQSESLHHKWRDKHWTWHKESDCVGNLDSLEPNSSQEQTKTQSKAKSQVCAGVGWGGSVCGCSLSLGMGLTDL